MGTEGLTIEEIKSIKSTHYLEADKIEKLTKSHD